MDFDCIDGGEKENSAIDDASEQRASFSRFEVVSEGRARDVGEVGGTLRTAHDR